MAKASSSRGVFPHWLSWLIDNPLRRLIISPVTLASRLPLSPSSRVLEVGPGSGYFSETLAARIAQGRLELFDIQPEMLAKAKRRLRPAGFQNVGYTVGDAGEDLSFPDGSFDLTLLVCVLGEVRRRERCLRLLHRVLRPDGVLAIHEAIPDPDRIPLERLQGLAEAHGFRIDRIWGRPWNYTATFVKSTTVEGDDNASFNSSQDGNDPPGDRTDESVQFPSGLDDDNLLAAAAGQAATDNAASARAA